MSKRLLYISISCTPYISKCHHRFTMDSVCIKIMHPCLGLSPLASWQTHLMQQRQWHQAALRLHLHGILEFCTYVCLHAALFDGDGPREGRRNGRRLADTHARQMLLRLSRQQRHVLMRVCSERRENLSFIHLEIIRSRRQGWRLQTAADDVGKYPFYDTLD